MIRGPVLPQLRASAWARLAPQLDALEHGLCLVLEGVDCSAGQFGLVEGLARDAMGAPVLVLVAVDGDGLLTARVHAACEFLARVGGALAAAVPEAELIAGAAGRVLVVGTDSGAAALELLCRLPLPGLEVCRVETFRVAGCERSVVHWLVERGAAVSTGRADRTPSFEVPVRCRADWDELQQQCSRIDPDVRWDGDRFSQRLTWNGRLLGRIETNRAQLWGHDAAGFSLPLASDLDRRRFVDRMLRRFAHLVGIADGAAGAIGNDMDVDAVGGGATSAAAADETLRTTLSTTRLSAEEYSALGGPTAVGSAEEGGSVADDVARIVTADQPVQGSLSRTGSSPPRVGNGTHRTD